MLVMTLARNYLDFTLTGKSSANCHIKPKKEPFNYFFKNPTK